MQIGFEEGRWALWSSQLPTEEGTPQGGLLPWAKNFLSSRQNPDGAISPFRPHPRPPLTSRWNVAPVKAGFLSHCHLAPLLSLLQPLPFHHPHPRCAHSQGHADVHTHVPNTLILTHKKQTYRPSHLPTWTSLQLHGTRAHMVHTHTRSHSQTLPQAALASCSLGGFPWPSDPFLPTLAVPRQDVRSRLLSEAGYHLHSDGKIRGKEEGSRTLSPSTPPSSLSQASDDEIKARRGSVTHRR